MKWYITLIAFLMFTSIVYAGVLTATSEEVSEGTRFTIQWGQGCSSGSLGPNACHPDPKGNPLWCPLSSTGNTELQHRCGIMVGKNEVQVCGCNTHYECIYTTGRCDSCPDPCDSCPSGTTCTSPTTDWCTTAPICEPIVVPCPYFCAESYSECNSLGGRSRSGYTCPSGGQRCCELPGSPPPPEPPPPGSTGCTGDAECEDLRFQTYRCNGDISIITYSLGMCSSITNSCEEGGVEYREEDIRDCSLESCFSFPMICVADSTRCSCT